MSCGETQSEAAMVELPLQEQISHYEKLLAELTERLEGGQ